MEEIKNLRDMLWLLEMSDHYDEKTIQELENKIKALEKKINK